MKVRHAWVALTLYVGYRFSDNLCEIETENKIVQLRFHIDLSNPLAPDWDLDNYVRPSPIVLHHQQNFELNFVVFSVREAPFDYYNYAKSLQIKFQ